MSVRSIHERPEALADLPGHGRYTFYELFDEAGTYALAATADAGEALELHLTVTRWGPRAARALERDMDWLAARARAAGKRRIVALRQEPDGRPDPVWPRFTARFGFTGHAVFQTAGLEL